MNNLKEGDKIKFVGDDVPLTTLRMLIRGVCDKVVFTSEIFTDENGKESYGPTKFDDIDDLITFGWTLEN